MTKTEKITQVIRLAIHDKDWSYKEFADKLGTNPPTICRYLSGHHNFTLKTLFKIEAVLGVNFFNV